MLLNPRARSNFGRLLSLCVTAVLFLSPRAWAQTNIDDLRARADAGDRAAIRRLAEAHYLGREGAEQNFGEAARWYLKLAQLGDRRAQTTIGLMYARGYGVKKDLAEAARWWNLAAAANDPGAQYSLATLYLESQDFAQAARWYREAAIRGHPQAQHNLGMMLYEGRGLEKDSLRAYYWIRVAQLQGDELADESLKKVRTGMTEDQIRSAEEQAREWLAKARKILK